MVQGDGQSPPCTVASTTALLTVRYKASQTSVAPAQPSTALVFVRMDGWVDVPRQSDHRWDGRGRVMEVLQSLRASRIKAEILGKPFSQD